MAGANFRAAFVAICFLGAFPPVDLRAVCLVRAMMCLPYLLKGELNEQCSMRAFKWVCAGMRVWDGLIDGHEGSCNAGREVGKWYQGNDDE